ncbi:MAG: DUF4956 domain-containing protein [Verrucomicrobia bacterium]|nr:DUF4956 domain-containing protein [Verrucomicrobiota bacterium]
MLLQIDSHSHLSFLASLVNKLGEKYFVRLLIDAIVTTILVYGIYLPNNHRNREYLFTFLMFNLVIFHVAFLLNGVTLSMGAAFGLFAVFGLLRYRTEDIPMKDMTYLFLSIALGLIVAVTRGNWEPAVVCAVILLPTFLLDNRWLITKELHQDVRYENIEMVKPENHPKLLDDLRNRTGLNIHFISIKNIDFVRDTATVRVFYYEQKEAAERPGEKKP